MDLSRDSQTSTNTSEFGKVKRGNEFAEWHVAWLGQRHYYAECNLCRMTKKNNLN